MKFYDIVNDTFIDASEWDDIHEYTIHPYRYAQVCRDCKSDLHNCLVTVWLIPGTTTRKYQLVTELEAYQKLVGYDSEQYGRYCYDRLQSVGLTVNAVLVLRTLYIV